MSERSEVEQFAHDHIEHWAQIANEAEERAERAEAERDQAQAALRAVSYRCHHGSERLRLTDIELVAARALAGQEIPTDGQFAWNDSAAPERKTASEHHADEIIRALVAMLTDEPEACSSLYDAKAEPWAYVESWCMFNNWVPPEALRDRLAAALGSSGEVGTERETR